jgi:hypothetical protein
MSTDEASEAEDSPVESTGNQPLVHSTFSGTKPGTIVRLFGNSFQIRYMKIGTYRPLLWLLLSLVLLAAKDAGAAAQGELSAAAYPTIQAAIDANPGQMIFIPAGNHVLSRKLRLRGDNSGLYGPGRIIQTNPEQPIIEIEKLTGVQLRDLTLTRAEGTLDTDYEGILAIGCRDLALDNVRVIDNRTRAGAIYLRECTGAQVRNCLVRNYMRITVDDRTKSADWGYAFKCIDGSGIVVTYSKGTLIQGNRIIEENLLPTQANQQKYELGKIIKRNATKGAIVNQKTWEADRVDNWHQGSGIIVTGPEVSDATQILGNQIENAAQGIDLHCDHVIVAQNIINNAFMGMKAMHGSRNVLITGNQFIRNDLWSIGLMPGAASHAALPGQDGQPARAANVDGGSIIANNIITDFGHGNAHWIWGDQGNPMRFDAGQKPENPPLTDVIIQGNIVYDSGRDKVIQDGQVVAEGPRYRYAIRVEGGPTAPKGLHFSNNVFHPGSKGVSNVELQP